MQRIIGRKNELETLDRVYKSNKSEFLIVYGRRRVGKTFLVNQRFSEVFSFKMTAGANLTNLQLLRSFMDTFNDSVEETLQMQVPPMDWMEAFRALSKYLGMSKQTRKVVFFDELPWFDTHGSDFLASLEWFWNSWASSRDDILLIGCGSAAAWMINELVNNKGGLHNRVTERILLQPFNLAETESFLKSKGASYDRYQLIELYMAMGGVPFYLDNIQVNRSVAQNIDRMCFVSGNILNTEYLNLFRSLFTKFDKHVSIVECLATKAKGMTRKELLTHTRIADGGTSTRILEELEQSGFIKRYFPFGKTKKDALFQLVDPYILFYLTFVKDVRVEGQGAWLAQLNSPKWRAWSGYAFEYICRSHIEAIKKALGISGVYTEISAWRSQSSEKGAQIDLVLDRNDRIINLCEMKFSTKPFAITKSYAEDLQNKLTVFRTETNTRKTVLLTFLTCYGLTDNQYSQAIVSESLGAEIFFEH